MKFLVEPVFLNQLDLSKDPFDQIMAIDGERYRDLPGRRTLKFMLGEKIYFIKQHFGTGWKEILKNLSQLKLPIISAENEYHAIRYMEKIGVSTLNVVGFGERGMNPVTRQSFLITDALEDTLSLEDIRLLWLKELPTFAFKQAMISEVANISRKLHCNGANHRDYYICHFLMYRSQFENWQGEPIQLFLIDLHRMQIRKKTPRRWQIKDIAGLYFSSMEAGLTQRDFFRFLKFYFQAPLREIFKKHQNFLTQVKERAMELYKKTGSASATAERPISLKKYLKKCLTNSRRVSAKWSFNFRGAIVRQYDTKAMHKFIAHPDQYVTKETMLKDGDTSTVYSLTLDQRKFVVKRYNVKGFFHLLKTFWRRSRSMKSFLSAHAFEYLNIPSVKPVAYFERRFLWFFHGRSYFIGEYLSGKWLNNFFEESQDGSYRAEVVKQCLRLFDLLKKNQIVHRDMKATNFIVHDHKVSLIDLDAVRLFSSKHYFPKGRAKDIRRFLKNWKDNPSLLKQFLALEQENKRK